MSINGTPESGPTRVGVPIVDYVTGYKRAHRHPVGPHRAPADGQGPAGRGHAVRHPRSACSCRTRPTGSARAAPRDASAALIPTSRRTTSSRPATASSFSASSTTASSRRFCRQVKREDLLEDPRFATNAARLQHAAVLRSEIERTLASFKVEDLCHDLMRSGVPAGAVNTVPQAFAQAHVAHRQMLIDQDGRRAPGIPREAHPDAGPARPARRRAMASTAARSWRRPGSIARPSTGCWRPAS